VVFVETNVIIERLIWGDKSSNQCQFVMPATSDRRLIEDFIQFGKFLPRLHEKVDSQGIFQRCICGTTPFSGGTGSGFRFLVAAPETYQKRTCLKKTMIDPADGRQGHNQGC